jgi:hypothetical protein
LSIESLDTRGSLWHIVTLMTVTSDISAGGVAEALSAETQLSIDVAIAQWLRSPRVTSSAYRRLRELGVPAPEIERRRRAQSADPALAGILRIAVTFVIARGRLERSDLRGIRPAPGAPLLRAIAAAAAHAFYDVAIAESVDPVPFAAIDMQIGDY